MPCATTSRTNARRLPRATQPVGVTGDGTDTGPEPPQSFVEPFLARESPDEVLQVASFPVGATSDTPENAAEHEDTVKTGELSDSPTGGTTRSGGWANWWTASADCGPSRSRSESRRELPHTVVSGSIYTFCTPGRAWIIAASMAVISSSIASVSSPASNATSAVTTTLSAPK